MYDSGIQARWASLPVAVLVFKGMNDSIRFLSGGIDRAGRAVADEGVEIQAAVFSDGVPVHPALQVWIIKAFSEVNETGLRM